MQVPQTLTESGNATHYREYVTDRGRNRYEVEHTWADKPDRYIEKFPHPADFGKYRDRIGGLLLLPKRFNASYGGLPYAEKLPHYRLRVRCIPRPYSPIYGSRHARRVASHHHPSRNGHGWVLYLQGPDQSSPLEGVPLFPAHVGYQMAGKKPHYRGKRNIAHRRGRQCGRYSDDDWLFLSSANLTQEALSINMELGMLVRGAMPMRVEEQFRTLIQGKLLERV